MLKYFMGNSQCDRGKLLYAVSNTYEAFNEQLIEKGHREVKLFLDRHQIIDNDPL